MAPFHPSALATAAASPSLDLAAHPNLVIHVAGQVQQHRGQSAPTVAGSQDQRHGHVVASRVGQVPAEGPKCRFQPLRTHS
jgi:hypothetical protein